MSMEDPCGKCDKREWVTNSSTQVTYHHVSHCCACARSAMDRLAALRLAGDALAVAAGELAGCFPCQGHAITCPGCKVRSALAAWKAAKP